MGKCIVFQGDSITDCCRNRETGVWPENQSGYGYALMAQAQLLSRHPEKNLQIFNRGISGNRVVDLYARWKIDTLNLNPDIISILIGVNDTWHEKFSGNGVELDRYGEIYRMLLAWTRKVRPGVKLVLIEPFIKPFGSADSSWLEEIAARGEIVRKLAGEFDATFVPLQHKFDELSDAKAPEYYLIDGIHPTLAGHYHIAQAAVAAIEPLL